MPLLLLFQALLQRFHELFKAAQRLDLRLFLVGEELFGQGFEPVGRDFRGETFIHLFKALEDMGEDPVELVEVALVLNEGRAGQIVEVIDVEADDLLIHRFHQHQVFAQRHRHLGVAQL